MHAPPPPRLLPPIPPLARLLVSGCLVALIAYLVWAFGATPEPDANDPAAAGTPPELQVVVPHVDREMLDKAKDATREQRLVLEPEPLKYLLRIAIDVGPTVAAALGEPERPVPTETLQADIAQWRGRWLWYEGEVMDLSGPRDGHPIPGYGIFEATVRLADGNHAITTFSLPPDKNLQRGSWVRIEGFLLKLRDTTYPLEMQQAPMLVGRAIQRDYPDWGPVHELDPEILKTIDDESFWPGDPMWRTIEEDQGIPLWHLAAYARDTAGERTLADWRQRPIANAPQFFDAFREQRMERGMPIRVIGTLIRRTTIAAQANPAGIRYWTIALVQVREWGGATLPIWVPNRVAELPLRAQLEVRAFYYRRFAFEAMNDQRHYVPLFVAADLDPYVLDTSSAMKEVGLVLLSALIGLVVLVWWGQRRAAKQTLRHQQHLDERRRRRRERSLNQPSTVP